MDKQQPKLAKITKYQETDKKRAVIGGSIIATLIAITPYIFYLYESAPADSTVWDTFFFTYDAKGWSDANFFAWSILGKAIPLLLLFIWFFTNRHWWYHALLVPIAMYVYQLFSLFNISEEYFDEVQLIYLIPIMAVIIPSIYLIRARMFNKMNETDKTMEELEDEFKIGRRSFKDYF